eukprot:5684455-Lingulodinium_polyedra.AAC.1
MPSPSLMRFSGGNCPPPGASPEEFPLALPPLPSKPLGPPPTLCATSSSEKRRGCNRISETRLESLR